MFTCIFATHYKVVSKSGRVLKILMKGKVETVAADCVKPAHIKREPETWGELAREVGRVGECWGDLVRELGRIDKQHGLSW